MNLPIRPAHGSRHLKESIEKELKELEHELRIELPLEIKKAVAMGDLRENAEYQTALERQGYLQARVGQLKQKLAQISLIRTEQVPKDRISLGSRFKAVDLDTDQEVEFEVVMEGMGDPLKGRIAITSPLARGFLNKKVGDEVSISVPSGKKLYEILTLKTVHDRSPSTGSGPSDT
ncbi:MAG: GreA/GreB family elongation factor [Acidobacteriota bacterium]